MNKYISKIEIDDSINIKRSQDIEIERKTAIDDLLHKNLFFHPKIGKGPYHLNLSLENRSVDISMQTEHTNLIKNVKIPILPFKGLIRDYFLVCENHYKMARSGSHMRIEAIDMGRRALHDEAATLLKKRLLQHTIETDLPTARRLFTLICVLHIRIMY